MIAIAVGLSYLLLLVTVLTSGRAATWVHRHFWVLDLPSLAALTLFLLLSLMAAFVVEPMTQFVAPVPRSEIAGASKPNLVVTALRPP